ncbi:hypothetical protein BH09VER1_BH09VER1_20990 [soil metagenome]
MNRDNLLSLYDRLTQLVEKLPGGLQKPILRELVPIRELFLQQRPARLMLLGAAGKSVPEFLHAIAGITVETGDSRDQWRFYRSGSHGEIWILDARQDTPQSVVEVALAALPPDAALFLRESDNDALSAESASQRLALAGTELPVVGISLTPGDSARARLSALMAAERVFSTRRNTVCSIDHPPAVCEAICAALPDPARLEFARITSAREAQAQIAGTLLKSFTAVCGVIGLQPIPLADMPILTTLQSFMVGLIVYTSGKKVSARLFAEFLGAMGLSIGAGMLFRESARALVKIIPLWGNTVSGMVAGAGTYAIGRAAIAYFIEELPIAEAKKLFNNLLPGWDAFKRRRLPSLPGRTKKEALPPKLDS